MMKFFRFYKQNIPNVGFTISRLVTKWKVRISRFELQISGLHYRSITVFHNKNSTNFRLDSSYLKHSSKAPFHGFLIEQKHGFRFCSRDFAIWKVKKQAKYGFYDLNSKKARLKLTFSILVVKPALCLFFHLSNHDISKTKRKWQFLFDKKLV